MENRFGFKDLISVVLFVTLIIVVLLGMKQLDRQGAGSIHAAARRGTDRSVRRDPRALDDIAANGVAMAGPATPTSANPSSTTNPSTNPASTPNSCRRPDPFGILKAAEKKPDFARGDWFVDNLPAKVKKITPLVSADLYTPKSFRRT